MSTPRIADRPASCAGLPDLLRSYAPQAGSFDEMLSPDGSVRGHYRALIEALAAMPAAERAGRFASAAQYLREAGVFYRVYGAGETGQERRDWPLAQPPLIIAEAEWTALTAGLVQRARFLEALAGDLYGERSVIHSGALPSAILAQNPEFMRPLADQGRAGAPLIRFIAVDLGRGPDGAWRVLGDRTQAPSGAGFALENRVATARAFPELGRALQVQRLAGFFQRFRDGLQALTGAETGRVGVLSPGPHNETYFEHAYLARYLGFLLLEGGDLAVRDDAVKIRTVDGFRPVRVLWRRLDADFADPLELYSGSRIGTPGLLRAVRAGNVEMVNALGSGILETPALLAFQPGLAEALIGEAPRLPTIATWWCGERPGLDHVLAHRDGLTLSKAFPAAAGRQTRRSLRDRPASSPDHDFPALDTDGGQFVGQERFAQSTAPVFVEGRLEPRPVTLRVFLARDEAGWHVMPGGFARIAESGDAQAISMQAGGRSVDVWVLGAQELRPTTLLGTPGLAFSRRQPGALPARAADNLYWLGRYCERAEAATRLLRLFAARQIEGAPDDPLNRRIGALLLGLGIDVEAISPGFALLDLARAAFDTASRIRDRFSPDGWQVLGEIVETIERRAKLARGEPLVALASDVLLRLAGFNGLVRENMYQFTGWRFLECGRRVERGLATANVAARLTADGGVDGALEALLEFTDSRVTHRRRYSVTLSPETVLDLAVLDPLNPRSIAFQVEQLKAAMDRLPGVLTGETMDPPGRGVARLKVKVETADAGEITPVFLERIASDFAEISDLLTRRYFVATAASAGERFDTE